MSSRYYPTHRMAGFVVPGPFLGDWFGAHDRSQSDPSEWCLELSTSKTKGGVIGYKNFSTLQYSNVDSFPADVRMIRFITPRLAGQTLGGTLNLCLNVTPFQDVDGHDIQARYHLHVYQTVGDSGAVRNVLIDDARGSTPWTFDYTYKFRSPDAPIALPGVTITEGDRIVIEVGVYLGHPGNSTVRIYTGTTGASPTYTPGTDAVAGDTTTTKVGWFDFSQTLTESSLPAAPPNCTYGTAVEIVSLPYTSAVYDTTQSTGTNRAVWYKWTATYTGYAVVHAFGSNYAPKIEVTRDTYDGYLVATATARIWGGRCQSVAKFAVTVGTTYFFQVISSTTGDNYGQVFQDSGGALRFSLVQVLDLQDGDLIVDCQYICRFRNEVLVDIETGLYGNTPVGVAVDKSGRALYDINNPGTPNTNPRIYVCTFGSSPLVEILDLTRFSLSSEVDFIFDPLNSAPHSENLSSILLDTNGRLILGFFGNNYDVVGVLATPPTGYLNTLEATHGDSQPGAPFAVADVHALQQENSGSDFIELAGDMDTLYYTSAGRTIFRWNLGSDAQGSPFATLPAASGVRPGLRSVRLLPGGGLLAADGDAIHRVDAGGNVIQTYTPTGDDAPYTSLDKVELTRDELTFWCSDQLATTLFQFNIESGAQLNSIKTYLPRGQMCGFAIWLGYHPWEVPGSASPSEPAGWNGEIDGTMLVQWQGQLLPTMQRLIRRLRQSPHLTEEEVTLFFASFQLDLEVGVGLPEGQGSDPQVMLQWSDDGGHTWSDEFWTSAGRQGKYQWQAIWRRLGRSRDRVWRVVVSDPVKWTLIDAWVNVMKGTG